MIIHIKRIGSMKLYVSRSEGSENPDQNALLENPDLNALLEDPTIKSQLEKSQ
jgi:hypothetical protein